LADPSGKKPIFTSDSFHVLRSRENEHRCYQTPLSRDHPRGDLLDLVLRTPATPQLEPVEFDRKTVSMLEKWQCSQHRMRTVRRRIYAAHLTVYRGILEPLEQVEIDVFPTAFVTTSAGYLPMNLASLE
jgi:hypothetical protein